MDRYELISEIANDPDNDAIRLRAAEWFENQGGESNRARSEFIRIQLERENLSKYDERQSELRFRELSLLKDHVQSWTAGHFAFKKCIFRRGFIEYVHLHLKHYLHHRRQLNRLEPIRDLRLTGWPRASDSLVERVASCEELRQIETLRLHNRGAHSEVQPNLLQLLCSPHLINLKKFVGCRVNFSDGDRRAFERLSILEQIEDLVLPSLYGSGETKQWLQDYEGDVKWAKLRSLSVYLRRSDENPLGNFVRQPFWKNLESLDIAGLDSSNDDGLLGLESLTANLPQKIKNLAITGTGIRTISLSGGETPDQSGKEFLPLFEKITATNLESLTLNYINLPPEGLSKILDPRSDCKIQSLALGDCEKVHLDTLANHAATDQLKSLSLVYSDTICLLDDDVEDSTDEDKATMLEGLVQSPAVSKLCSLSLWGFRLKRDLLNQLARNAKSLQQLSLSDSNMLEEDMRGLLQEGCFEHLNWLEVGNEHCGNDTDGNQRINVEIANALGNFPRLIGLSFKWRPPNLVEVMQTLLAESSVRWGAVENYSEGNNASYRMTFAPKYWPPTNEGFKALQRWL